MSGAEDVVVSLAGVEAKATLILLGAWACAICTRRWSAGARHLVWAAAITAALALPLVARVVPPAGVPSLATLATLGRAGATTERTVGAPPLESRGGAEAAARLDALAATGGWTAQLASAPLARRGATGVLGVWGAGVACVLLWWSAGLVALHARSRRAALVGEPRVLALRDQLSSQLGVRRTVPLLVGDGAVAPMTWGALRPVIMLPASWGGWPDDRLANVLRHELAHVARRDCLLQVMAHWLCALHWFNPLAWLAARRLAAECEHACDDAALGSGARAASYAGTLVAVAADVREMRFARPAVGTVGMAGSALERRVREILDDRAPRRVPGRAQRVAAAAAAAMLVVPLAALRRAEPAARPPSTRPALTTAAAQADTGTGELVPLDSAVEAAVLAASSRPAAGPDSAVIEVLRTALSHRKRGATDLVRERAVWTLSIARGGRVVEPLIGRLRDPDWRVRAYAGWGLAVAGDERAVEPLIQSLRDEHWRPRMHAAYALGELHAGSAAVDPLIAALADTVYQVRVSAVTALGQIGDRRALPAIRARAIDSHAWVRMAAREAEVQVLSNAPSP
ncbi:MAG TPA: M56 family metallopeptidase [Gemmatimonadaceae bacterium]|nr:M56 family metallopeptidase [Gemmatimonadaceae bacterium]